jgi:hypothetical protein
MLRGKGRYSLYKYQRIGVQKHSRSKKLDDGWWHKMLPNLFPRAS